MIGYVALEHDPFNWKDIYTYLPALIRFFQSIFSKRYCPYNHVVTFASHNGVIYVYEAQAYGVIRTRLIDYVKKRDLKNFLLLKPNFYFDPIIFNRTMRDSLGKKYDFTDGLFNQLVQQLTDERFDFSTQDINKKIERFYCSELVAYGYYEATNQKMFKDFGVIDPEDFFEMYYQQDLFSVGEWVIKNNQ